MSSIHHIRIAVLLTFCLLAFQCTGRQEERPVPIQFYLDDGVSQHSKGAFVMEPTALFPSGAQQDTLWIAAVAREMRAGTGDTKGIPYNSTDGFPLDGELGLIAYQYASVSADSTYWTLFTATNDSRTLLYQPAAGRWIPNPELNYPSGEGFVRFFAFGPKDASVDVSATNYTGPVLSYTVPSSIGDQKGLLVASPNQRSLPPGLSDMSVRLNLKHTLSGVSFAVDKVFKLKSVTVSGVYDEGDYYIASARWGGWGKSIETAPGPSYFIGTFNPASSSYYGSDMDNSHPAYDCVAAKYTLMMIPQRVPVGATITVQLDGESSRSINIGGQLWEKGKLVTYLIALEKEYLRVMIDEDLFTWEFLE